MTPILSFIEPIGPSTQTCEARFRILRIEDGKLIESRLSADEIDGSFLVDRNNRVSYLKNSPRIEALLEEHGVPSSRRFDLSERPELQTYRQIRVSDFLKCFVNIVFDDQWRNEISAIVQLAGDNSVPKFPICNALTMNRDKSVPRLDLLTLSNLGAVDVTNFPLSKPKSPSRAAVLSALDAATLEMPSGQNFSIYTPDPKIYSALVSLTQGKASDVGLVQIHGDRNASPARTEVEQALAILAGWLGDFGCAEIQEMRASGIVKPVWTASKAKPIVNHDFINRWADIFVPPDRELPVETPVPENRSTLRVADRILRFKSSEHKNQIEAWLKLEQPLPLMPIPPMKQLISALRAEFGWMTSLIDAVEGELALRLGLGQTSFRLPPLLLLGPPGCGKTRFARRLSELASIPNATIAGAMSSDTRALAGTARGWSTAQPGMPLILMATAEVANPIIVIDEVEKSRGTHNGDLKAALLGLLERESARLHFDECLMTKCNLGEVTWILTANDKALLPHVLTSRLSIHEIDPPGLDYFETILNALRHDLAAEFGVDQRLLPRLDPDAFDALQTAFQDGRSVRELSRAYRSALAAGERTNKVMTI